jgi:hypothetical protein
MREKNYNSGLRGVLFEARHYEKMGAAVWLYGWLVLRQMHQSGEIGWVLGGAPISYREVEDETGFGRRTLERWMHALRRNGYIETTAAPSGVVVRIMKAKKYAQPPRNIAEGVRTVAGRGPQNCPSNSRKSSSFERDASRICSSSIVRIKENPACLGANQNSKQNHQQRQNLRQQQHEQQTRLHESRVTYKLLRLEREELLRRALAVGAGPEVNQR